jgi:hypothetical protein
MMKIKSPVKPDFLYPSGEIAGLKHQPVLCEHLMDDDDHSGMRRSWERKNVSVSTVL